MPVEFHPDAEWELTEAQAWYRQRSDVAAQAFALEIDHALRSITEAPERWPKMQRGERRFLLARFPYSILYRIRGNDIFIIAVAHLKRRPGYWRSRR